MSQVNTWISVDPAVTSAAILGPLPTTQETVTYSTSAVVPETATGILVFAWYAVAGVLEPLAYWHIAVNNPDGSQNWFSVILASAAPANSVQSCFSQEFWLPMPVDGNLQVTLNHANVQATLISGVEIHGYVVGSAYNR